MVLNSVYTASGLGPGAVVSYTEKWSSKEAAESQLQSLMNVIGNRQRSANCGRLMTPANMSNQNISWGVIMDFDGLVTSMRKASNDPVVLRLCELLSQWKDGDSNVQELESMVERYFGNTWIASDIGYKDIYRLWSEFRDDAVHGIHGMTMNERLFCFSLLPRFESANTDQQLTALYAKVLAAP